VRAGRRFVSNDGAILTSPARNWPRSQTREPDPKHAFEMGRMNGRKRRESGRRHYGQDAPIAEVGVRRSERLPIARFHHRPAALPAEATRAAGGPSNRVANYRRRGQRVTPITPDQRRMTAGPARLCLVHTRQNSVFTACAIFALDTIQSLDHASESSLELDSYSRTTIRRSNKPRPWCRRNRERCRRTRHNRSCNCPIVYRWRAESGHAF
jgi:hypothetical protein